MLLFIKTGFINAVLLKINLYILEVSSLSYLFFDFLQSKRGKRQIILEREPEIICFMFRNNFFYKNTVGERHPRCFKKRGVGPQNLMFRKCYFQDIGKITNRRTSLPISGKVTGNSKFFVHIYTKPIHSQSKMADIRSYFTLFLYFTAAVIFLFGATIQAAEKQPKQRVTNRTRSGCITISNPKGPLIECQYL